MEWFGKSWNAPVNNGTQQVGTPVGDDCVRCGMKIIKDDQGVILPSIDGVMNHSVTIFHRRCFLQELGIDKVWPEKP